MRTTVDLPDELFRALKVKAAQQGESVKDIVTRAVSREVTTTPASRMRVDLPLIAHGEAPVVDVTSDDVAAALDSDDERYAG